MKKISLFVFILLLYSSTNAQYSANNWYFGQNAGITFKTYPPTCLNNGKTDTDGMTSVISDANGDVVAYSDGKSVWNKNHQIMPNGANINGSSSSGKEVMFVPNPAKQNEYYLFSSSFANNYPTYFTYSVIDVFANGGLGDVDPARKNVNLFSPATGQITATVSGDNKGYWVMGAVIGTKEIYSYYLGENGLVTTPVVSTSVGVNQSIVQSIRVSPDGSKVVKVTPPNIEVYEFDNLTGKLSNPVSITNSYANGSMEFSPDGSKIYIKNSSNQVLQYDLTVHTSAAMNASRKNLANVSASAFQLGPDGKIYFTGNGDDSKLSVIENPNDASSKLIISEDKINLCAGSSSFSLPNFIQGIFYADIIVNNACLSESTDMKFKTPAEWVAWNFGEPSSGANNIGSGVDVSHTYSAEGTYTVQAIYYAYGKKDTLEKTVTIYPKAPKISIGEDKVKCFGDLVDLTYTPFSNPLVSYKWSTNETQSTISVAQDGNYWLEVNLNGCKARDTLKVVSNNCALPFKDTINYCNTTSVNITTEKGNAYLWSNGKTTQQITYTIADGPTVSVKIDKTTINPVLNYDFESGITSYTTAYATSQWVNGGEYLITNSFNYYSGVLKDHSTSNGTGKMIVVNPNSSGVMFEQSNITVEQGLPYTFSFWVARADQNNTNSYSVSINGTNVSGNLTSPTGNAWQLVQIPWTATSNKANIQFVNNSSSNAKIGFDDISLTYSFRKTIEYRLIKKCNSCVKPSALSLGTISNKTTYCTGDFLTLKPTFTLGTAQNTYYYSIFTPNGTRVYNSTIAPQTADLKKLAENGLYNFRIEDGNNNDASCYLQANSVISVSPYPTINLGNDTTICAGKTLTLNAGTADSYLWSTAETSSSIAVNTANKYLVEIETNGCKAKDSINVSIQALPTINLGNDINSCVPVTLDAGAAKDAYLWSTAENSRSITASISGQYFVIADSLFCANTDTINVTISNNLSFDIGNDTTICQGNSLQLDAGNADTYLWSTTENSRIITVNTAGKYVVEITSGTCVAKDSINISFQTLPTLDLGKDTTICSGKTLTLNAGTADSYLWSTVETSSSIAVNTANKYLVEIETNGCKAKDSINVSVQALPTINLGNDINSCVPVILDAGAAKDAYLWSTTETSQSITASISGQYFVIADSLFCTNTDTINVTISNNLSFDIGNDTSICQGKSLQLDAGNADTYLWSTTENSQIITVNTAGKYVVEITSGTCVAKDSINISFQTLPTLDLGKDTTICAGKTLTLSAGTADSYLWSTAETSASISVNTAKKYLVEISKNGCKAKDSINVSLQALPTLDLGKDTTICAGKTLTLNAGTADSYLWSTAETSASIAVNTAKKYLVEISKNGCIAKDSILIETQDLPKVSLGVDTALCAGESLILSAENGSTYIWSTDETTQTINVNLTNEYFVRVDSAFCSNFDTILVTFNSILSTNIETEYSICNQDSLKIHPELAGGIIPSSLTFLSGSNVDYNSSKNEIIFSPEASSSYSLSITDEIACVKLLDIIINVVEKPELLFPLLDTTLCQGDEYFLYPIIPIENDDDYSFTWFIDNEIGAEVKSKDSILTIIESGKYFLETSINSTSCSFYSDTISFEFENPIVSITSSSLSVKENEMVSLRSTFSEEINELLWLKQDTISTSSIAQDLVTDNTWYYLIGKSEHCFASDSVLIQVVPILQAPNVFTPNGDGADDVFMIKGIDKYPSFQVFIFNRWGDLIYTRSNYYSSPWTGDSYPEGVYFYIINDTSSGKSEHSGVIHLIR